MGEGGINGIEVGSVNECIRLREVEYGDNGGPWPSSGSGDGETEGRRRGPTIGASAVAGSNGGGVVQDIVEYIVPSVIVFVASEEAGKG